MRKLPDWLQREEALAASSKSHQYLQMNINSLRRLLGKMKQTTPALKAKSSITLSHSTIQLWILAIFLLAHIALLPGEALLRLWNVLTRVLIFTAIVLLPSILLRGFQNSGLFLGRTGILVLNLSLFLATTTSIQLVEALRQLHFPKTMIQTIELAMKYTYILGKHLQQQIECVQLRTIGQKVNLGLFGSILGLLYLSSKNHTKEVYEAMTLRGYGMDVKQKATFRWKKEDVLLLLELIVLVAATTMLR